MADSRRYSWPISSNRRNRESISLCASACRRLGTSSSRSRASSAWKASSSTSDADLVAEFGEPRGLLLELNDAGLEIVGFLLGAEASVMLLLTCSLCGCSRLFGCLDL